MPIVLDVQKLEFSGSVKKLLKEKLDSSLFETAQKNSRKINVYKIKYLSQGHAVVGFIIEPKKSGVFPCIIYSRGGSNDFGAIVMGKLFISLAKFALWDYILIASQYSGCGGSEGTDTFGGPEIEDVLNLYKILKGYSKADHKRVGMYDGSRGGMMTYLALAKVKWIRVAVTIAGTADEVGAPKFRRGWAEHQRKMYGGSMAEKRKRSAVLWADKFSKKTPLLLMHGTADWRVNPLDSINLAKELYKNKVPFRLIIFEGADHSLSEFPKEKDSYTKFWFDKYLKEATQINLKPHGN